MGIWQLPPQLLSLSSIWEQPKEPKLGEALASATPRLGPIQSKASFFTLPTIPGGYLTPEDVWIFTGHLSPPSQPFHHPCSSCWPHLECAVSESMQYFCWCCSCVWFLVFVADFFRVCEIRQSWVPEVTCIPLPSPNENCLSSSLVFWC